MLCADLSRFNKGLRIVVDRLPRSATEKVARAELRDSFADAAR